MGGVASVCFSFLCVWLSLFAGDSSGTCGDPGTPAHASREVMGNFKVRSKVRFTCAVGHTLYGSAERICFPNGTWSGKQPFCKRKWNSLKKLYKKRFEWRREESCGDVITHSCHRLGQNKSYMHTEMLCCIFYFLFDCTLGLF